MSKSLIRKNQLHPDISDLVGQYGSGFFISFASSGDLINSLAEIVSGDFTNTVRTTGDQTVSGVKAFILRPTVNGTGVLLSGEAAQADLSSTVRTTGDQTISGVKTFQSEIAGSKDFNFEMPLQNLGPSPAKGLKLIGGNFTGSKYFGEHVFISGGRGNNIGGHIVLQGGNGAVLNGEVAGWGDYFRFNGIPIIDQFGRVIAPDVLTNRNNIIVNRNIFSILNTGRGNTFGGEIVISGGSSTGVGQTPATGGPIRFIGGSGGQGISGFFDFIGGAITFNNSKFLVQKEGDVICRSLYASTGSSVALNSGEIKCLSFSCVERPFVNGTGVLLSGEAAQADLSSTVRTTGDQTISGVKTFATTVNFANGFPLYIPSKDAESISLLGSDIGDIDDFGTHLFIESGRSGLSSIYRSRFQTDPSTFNGYGIVFGSIRGSGVSAKKGYLTAFGGITPTGLEYATLIWTDRILSGQWKTNQKLLVNNTGVLLSGEAVASNGTVTRMIKLTQAQYNALSPVDPTTFYVIIG